MTMRRVFGTVQFPEATPSMRAEVVVEVLDVSRLDSDSRRLAVHQRASVEIGPRARLDFDMDAPRGARGASLSLRVHVDLDGSGLVSSGDFITTTSIPVSESGDCGPMEVPVNRV